MSFSKRESKWANAALVVSLSPKDVAEDVTAMEGADAGDSPLRGVRWQSAMERRAAEMGGGNLGEGGALGRGWVGFAPSFSLVHSLFFCVLCG